MGKKGRDRSQRRRRFEDDQCHGGQDYGFQLPSGFAPRESDATSGPAIDGTVKWFNPDKGFGFVELSDGSGDVFMHAAVLEAAGHENVAGGAKVSVRVGVGRKGRQVTAVLAVDASTASAASASSKPHRRPSSQPSRSDPSAATRVEGTVKWYNAEKRFGFVSCADGDKDVFVHASVLEQGRLMRLDEGQKVEMQVVATPKGREAISIALVN